MKFNFPNTNKNKPKPIFDVFISYNSSERTEIEQFLGRLQNINKKIKIWYDRWYIQAGQTWRKVIEDALIKSKSMIVYIGSSGLGPWQEMETEAWIREFINYSRPIIPIISSSAEKLPQLPIFLKGYQYVNYHEYSMDEGDLRVFCGITGVPFHKKLLKIIYQEKESLKENKIEKRQDNFSLYPALFINFEVLKNSEHIITNRVPKHIFSYQYTDINSAIHYFVWKSIEYFGAKSLKF